MSHTHAPGEPCTHTPQPAPQPAAQKQSAGPNPDVQALIDQDFKAVNLDLTTDSLYAVCNPHKLEKCTECDLDFSGLNRLTRLLVSNPTFKCPPPHNVVSQSLSKAINTTKEEGNALFKMKRHLEAIGRYTMAASVAAQRYPWEANQFMREELSTILSNRSAAYFEAGDYIGAIADADTVIQLRRNWSKGHFRKAKGLLGLGKWEDAKDAVRLGLQFEPNNKELNDFLADIERVSTLAKNKTSSDEKITPQTPPADASAGSPPAAS